MSTIAKKVHVSSGHQRRMFEHVNRRGQVSVLPLTPETRRFFAAGNLGERAGVNRNLPDARQSGADGLEPENSVLTARELQVFDLLISGLSNKLIAYELSISPRTVEVHRAHLMKKMGVRNAAALVRLALTAA
ncbi:MAG TPA: LuxR C-terminal-related transcriptional regulator [Rhizomicrobium sp.]|nr:LuxR C-terminal-related transcriptional regulator [Rhizomicrobium sp.]